MQFHGALCQALRQTVVPCGTGRAFPAGAGGQAVEQGVQPELEALLAAAVHHLGHMRDDRGEAVGGRDFGDAALVAVGVAVGMLLVSFAVTFLLPRRARPEEAIG